MPSRNTKLGSVQLKRWTAVVRTLTQSLPSPEEKAALLAAVDDILSFFAELRQRLEALPTVEETPELQQKMEALTFLFQEIERLPALSRAVQARRVPLGKASGTEGRTSDSESSESILAKLNSGDESGRIALQQCSGQQLRTIASQLGLPTSKHTDREALIRQISMRVANHRGYELLRGPMPPSEQET